jgi:hypothetical protein
MLEAIRVNRTCAFCEKPEVQVEYLIEGPFAYICNECVATSTGLLEQRRSPTESGENAKGVIQGFAPPGRRYAYEVLRAHFGALASDSLVTSTRVFPARARADLQRPVAPSWGSSLARWSGKPCPPPSSSTASFASVQ